MENKKPLFDQIEPVCKDKKEAMKAYLNSYVKCPDCGTRRKVKNCKRYTEIESWEMPWIKYEVCICPKCGADMEKV